MIGMTTCFRLLLCAALLAAGAFAQTAATPALSTTNPLDVQATLQRIEQTAQAAALDIARLRVEKWKTESEVKSQAQANADSLSRNMTTALPTLVNGVRTTPQNLTASFKLYRNLNALYDVFEGLTESAGAFGSRQEFESLSRHVQELDAHRRALGDYVEALAAARDAETTRRATAPPPAAKPKKIIVDNGPTTTKKKR